jgi:uncharacterized protein (TIGR03435 family)
MTLHALQIALRAAAHGLADHLWQSTLFTILVAIAATGLRKNQARVRFGLWMAASLKFLVPFASLEYLGSLAAPRHGGATGPERAYAFLEQASQPFRHASTANGVPTSVVGLPALVAAVWLLGTLTVLAIWLLRWRQVSVLASRARIVSEGRELDAVREQLRGKRPLELRVSAEAMEPGIFGIVRPALIWPERISEELSDAQLRSILAHELWHVRRRDNLCAAAHMLVEALFWFHPLVWWVGARLLEERERACDEEVLRLGNDAEAYAEGILSACKFCIESPLSCVAGVAGSNLKRRIARIMKEQNSQKLTLPRRVFLAAAAVTVIAGPFVLGVMRASRLNAQVMQGPNSLSAAAGAPPASFDSVSIKPANPSDDKILIQVGDHTFSSNATVKELIKFAYGIDAYQIEGVPEWAASERYEIVGTWKDSPAFAEKAAAMPGPPPPPPPAPKAGMVIQSSPAPFQLQAMVQNVLKTKFQLKWNSQIKDMPVYDLVVASGGAKLTPIPTTPPPPSFNGEPIISVRSMIRKDKGELELSNGPVGALAGSLSPLLDHQVIDKTGIQGSYDITLHWNPEQNLSASIDQSLEEQLGLKLQPEHGPVKMMAVSQVEKPDQD